MASFPPLKGGNSKSISGYGDGTGTTVGPTSTGSGGIPKSLKIKAAGTKDAPGLEKNVNLF